MPITHKIALIAPVDGLTPLSLVASDVNKKLESVILGTGLDYDSFGNLSLVASEINHDSLLGFVANEHIDHTTVSISPGTGMSGGGDISATRTLSCTITQYTDALARAAVIAATIVDGDLTHSPDGNSVFDALALKSPIASPTFTGTVTLPASTSIPDGGTIGQAAGPLLTFDDTLNYLEITGCNVGINKTTPQAPLDIQTTGYPGLVLTSVQVDHGMTGFLTSGTNTYGYFGISNLTKGGFTFLGASDTNDATGLFLWGIIGSEDPVDTTPALILVGAKKAGTGCQSLGSSETVLQIYNYIACLVTFLGNGNTGIGLNVPSAKLHIDQSSTTEAIPVLTLDQADVSEEFIRFIGTAASGVVTQSIVKAADVETATLAGYVKVYVQDDGNQIADQSYYMPVYTLA